MALQTMISTLSSGMLKSILIYVCTLVGALPLGLLVAFGRMSRIKPVQLCIKFYISVMRGTPLMLQLMVVFFGPYFLLNVRTGSGFRFAAVIIGFVLNYAAYFAEIYRGGIESISRGQYEAAQVLGYSKTHTFIYIILPQVVKRILPSVTNEMITLVKDTSLAFAISYAEMFTMAKQIASSHSTLMPFVVAGIFYYIFNFIVAFAMERCEKRLAYYR
ncbi:MAG: amino acid ABC transporter permease [Oscillospiraceae bacterium]|nr:amino acid ABC transporter permease [Oscillospiraceae bacterium]